MIPFILAGVGGYLLGQSTKAKSFSDGGVIDSRFKAFNELKKYMGIPIFIEPDDQEELQITMINDNELLSEIRYWGEWEHADNSKNIEDDDFMVLSKGSEKRLNDIISIVQKRYPVSILWETEEKNWLVIKIINK